MSVDGSYFVYLALYWEKRGFCCRTIGFGDPMFLYVRLYHAEEIGKDFHLSLLLQGFTLKLPITKSQLLQPVRSSPGSPSYLLMTPSSTLPAHPFVSPPCSPLLLSPIRLLPVS